MVVFDLSYFRDPVRYPGTAVSSPLVPVLITALLAYIIADKVLQVRGAWVVDGRNSGDDVQRGTRKREMRGENSGKENSGKIHT